MTIGLFRHRFGVRIFLSFLLIILIPFAITLATSYHVIREALAKELRENLRNNVIGYAEQVRFLEEGSLRLARELSTETGLVEDLARGRIGPLRDRLAHYHRLGIADLLEIENLEGEVVARGHMPHLAGDLKAQQAIIRAGLEGRSVVSYERGRSGLAVRAVAPIVRNGRLLGLLMAGASFSEELVHHMKLLTGLENGIYTGEEKLVATYADFERLAPATVEILRRGEIAFGGATINGRDCEAAFHPLFLHDGTWWGALAMAVDRDQLDRFSRSTRNLLFLLVGVGLVIAAIIYLILARHIHAALTSILRGIDEVRVDDFSASIDWRSEDEFGRIAESFNRMVRKLQLYHGRIGELQEEMIRAAKSATAGRIAAGMAHEIRNPLSSIRLMVQVLKRRAGATSEKEADLVLEEIDRIDRLVKQLLEFGRPTPMHFARHELNSIVEEVVKLFRHQIEHQAITLDLRLDPATPPFMMDAEKIRIVIVNLVHNAIQAMPDGGTLAIATGIDAARREAVIRIADTGVGIAPENRRKVFDPFFSSKADGTGLGLALTEAIVVRHDGKVEIEEGPGPGARFRVVLPVGAASGELVEGQGD